MLLNATATDRVVHEGQLIAAAEGLGLVWDDIAGEQGHYYRFSGQQNPTENDGSVVTQVTLRGEEAHWGRPRGDGVLLVRSPNLVVAAAVIIDTERFSTSPAAEPATTHGFTGSCGEDGRQGFRVGYGSCSNVNPFYGYQVSPAGQSGEAIFEANLVHDGPYRVYEFHPQTDGHDVPHIVDHDTGTDTVYVDQTTSAEQWNLLGTYHFTATEPARVTISAMASGTEVAADAIRFEYAGEPALCGNGLLDFGEVCDSSRPISGSCVDLGLGYDGGTLACASDCSGWDETGCTSTVPPSGTDVSPPGVGQLPGASGGCACQSSGSDSPPWPLGFLLLLFVLGSLRSRPTLIL